MAARSAGQRTSRTRILHWEPKPHTTAIYSTKIIPLPQSPKKLNNFPNSSWTKTQLYTPNKLFHSSDQQNIMRFSKFLPDLWTNVTGL